MRGRIEAILWWKEAHMIKVQSGGSPASPGTVHTPMHARAPHLYPV